MVRVLLLFPSCPRAPYGFYFCLSYLYIRLDRKPSADCPGGYVSGTHCLDSRQIKIHYGKLLISGFVSILAIQFLWNILMNLGMAPISSVGLPFISYGGSQLVINAVPLGSYQASTGGEMFRKAMCCLDTNYKYSLLKCTPNVGESNSWCAFFNQYTW